MGKGQGKGQGKGGEDGATPRSTLPSGCFLPSPGGVRGIGGI